MSLPLNHPSPCTPEHDTLFAFNAVCLSPMQELLPDILRQTARPSPHSIIILLSHLGYIWCVAVSYKKRYLYECLTFTLATLISLTYHVCDDKIYCVGMPLEGWHFLDVYYTFYTVMVLTLYLCGVRASDAKLMMVNVYSTFMVALVHFARFTVGANIALWAVPFTFFMVSLFSKKIVSFDVSTLGKVTIYLLIAVASFVLANFTGFNRLPDEERLRLSPTAPETDVYWLFHSLWHFFSQVAIGYLLLAKKDSPAAKQHAE